MKNTHGELLLKLLCSYAEGERDTVVRLQRVFNDMPGTFAEIEKTIEDLEQNELVWTVQNMICITERGRAYAAQRSRDQDEEAALVDVPTIDPPSGRVSDDHESGKGRGPTMRPDKPCVHGVAIAAPCYNCAIEHNADLIAEVEKLRADLSTAKADARRAALEECMRLARGTKEDGLSLAKKAHDEGQPEMERSWRGEAEGAAEIERDIMNLLGIDWANGETEVRS